MKYLITFNGTAKVEATSEDEARMIFERQMAGIADVNTVFGQVVVPQYTHDDVYPWYDRSDQNNPADKEV